MKKSRMLVLVAVLTLVAAACGGGADPDPAPENDGGNNQDQDSNNNDGNGGGTAGGGFEIPEIDPGSMPPPGEARVEVDGKTFTFVKNAESERLFTCEIRADGISVNFQNEGHDLLLQGATQADGSILASTTISPVGEDARYESTNAGGRGGGVAVDGSNILFVGQFDKTPVGDPANFADVGQGSVAVTCP